eukprot:CAMPEP_0175411184 /NCGR_PEP_ID=MMETSP0095-20121207/41991_1 /TAXON_ID=311494 /ORGANISM="Alexandrium monilatum, Strain CCMP3105" /LENGTH=456 /DNA_ID=CAMNT_0016710153 /DNA_START=271 /DNA_END=1639 /DNA_ORIENTATION=+
MHAQADRALGVGGVREHVEDRQRHSLMRGPQRSEVPGQRVGVAGDVQHVLEAGDELQGRGIQPRAGRVDEDRLCGSGPVRDALRRALGLCARGADEPHVPDAVGLEVGLGRRREHAVDLHRDDLLEVGRQGHGVAAAAAVQLQEPEGLLPGLAPDLGGLAAEPVEAVHLAGRIWVRELALRLPVLAHVPIRKAEPLDDVVPLHHNTSALPPANHVHTPRHGRLSHCILQGPPEFASGCDPPSFVLAGLSGQPLVALQAPQTLVVVHKAHEQVSRERGVELHGAQAAADHAAPALPAILGIGLRARRAPARGATRQCRVQPDRHPSERLQGRSNRGGVQRHLVHADEAVRPRNGVPHRHLQAGPLLRGAREHDQGAGPVAVASRRGGEDGGRAEDDPGTLCASARLTAATFASSCSPYLATSIFGPSEPNGRMPVWPLLQGLPCNASGAGGADRSRE